MTYATLPDLILRYGERQVIQLTDRADPPARLVDAQVAGGALTYADNTIDGYIAKRYRLPLSQAQPILTELALDLAWYRLQTEPTRDTTDRYNAAIRSLKDIASGALELPGEAGSGAPAAVAATVETVSQGRIFTRRSMRDL